jgi:hypothetical protein
MIYNVKNARRSYVFAKEPCFTQFHATSFFTYLASLRATTKMKRTTDR